MTNTGIHINSAGEISYRIFAPYAHSLAVKCLDNGKCYPLEREDSGYFTGILSDFRTGFRYLLVKNCTETFPDPASRFQPEGSHGPSQAVFPTHQQISSWQGIDAADAIIYELHIGTFSPEGTLQGALQKIPFLRDLGINVIELMPLSDFPGKRNWGYDGTYPFALSRNYGSYTDLHDFIATAHNNGIAVILDVVFNHFGPEGNYSEKLAPFTRAAPTPWGAQINFDGNNSFGIRSFFLDCVRHWLEDTGLDGFRMDAVSVIYDETVPHILREITDLARSIGSAQNRKIIMIAEHLRNESSVTAKNGLAYDAQWCDDLNYAVYSWLYPQSFRHYRDFGRFEDIVLALKEGFCYNGTRYNSVFDNFMGVSGQNVPPAQLIMHIQDHDQVGNRPEGGRIVTVMGLKRALLAALTLFASPYIPMLFMGEEYGEKSPFLFFEDFSDTNLIEAVKKGRRKEFSFIQGFEPEDPHLESSFLKSKLKWYPEDSAPEISVPARKTLRFYQELIRLKKSGIIGSHDRKKCQVKDYPKTGIITITGEHAITLLNFGGGTAAAESYGIHKKSRLLLTTEAEKTPNTDPFIIPGYTGAVYEI